MLYYDRTDLTQRIDAANSNNSKNCIICHYWFFNRGFKFQDSISCHDLTMLCLNINDYHNYIITVKGVAYPCIIHDISKSEAIHPWLKIVGIYKLHIKEINTKNQICNCYFNYSIKAKKIETKSILTG